MGICNFVDISSPNGDNKNLNDLPIFVQVIDHGGFSSASRALGLPKQTLSKRVGELERRAGVRLIQRTSRSFAVTELGRELYRHAAAMVIEAEVAENVILGRMAEPSGTVRVTASIPTAQGRLSTLLPRIATAYPKIRVVLHANDRFVDIVQEGYDLALRNHYATLPDSNIVQRRVDVEQFWLVAASDFIGKELIEDPTEIAGLAGVFSAERDNTHELRNREGQTHSLVLEPRYVANEGTAILAAAKAGMGIASLPSSMCERDVSSGALMRVCPDWSAGEITTTLLMPHRRGLLPSVRIVADLIIENLSSRANDSHTFQ